MMSSNSSDDYIFEYRLDNNYNYYKYNKDNTSSFDKPSSLYSLGRPTFNAYETYPSHITVTLNNKQESWIKYIKRQMGRLFGCFSIKIYSQIPVEVGI